MGLLEVLGRVGPVWVRFGAVTGRHRGRAKTKAVEDGADEGAPRGRRVVVIVGAFAVPVVLAGAVVFGMRAGPVRERPESTPAPHAAPATPESEPTYGKYVPPGREPQVATKPPPQPSVPVVRPRRATAPTLSVSPTQRVRRPCPAGWDDVEWMRRWCERHGHHDD